MGKVKLKGCQRANNYGLSGTLQVDGYIVSVENESVLVEIAPTGHHSIRGGYISSKNI